MRSDTKNVKLGVCKLFYGGIDLGYTKGGVEVSVATETYKVEVDQFGKSPINELIMGRTVTVTAPLAETTLHNLVRTMPGATLVQTGGAKASGSITLVDLPMDGETVLINGKTVTFVSSDPNPAALEVLIGADENETAANLAAMLNASNEPGIAEADYSASGATVNITYSVQGVDGNSFTLGSGTSGATVSGATLTGGMEPTAARVDVTNSVGVDLLTTAKELRLHPQHLPDDDRSEDFVVHRAATGGSLSFAYKYDEERVFNTEFQGYPDTSNGNKLFSYGDPAA